MSCVNQSATGAGEEAVSSICDVTLNSQKHIFTDRITKVRYINIQP